MNEVNQELPVSADWKAEPAYVCVTCGDPARMHPQTNHIWGCLKCGVTTASVAAYFKRVTPVAPPPIGTTLDLYRCRRCGREMAHSRLRGLFCQVCDMRR